MHSIGCFYCMYVKVSFQHIFNTPINKMNRDFNFTFFLIPHIIFFDRPSSLFWNVCLGNFFFFILFLYLFIFYSRSSVVVFKNETHGRLNKLLRYYAVSIVQPQTEQLILIFIIHHPRERESLPSVFKFNEWMHDAHVIKLF